MLGRIILLLFLLFNFDVLTEAQTKNGIVNGRATYLPKPEYTEEAKNFCAGGKIEVEVKFHNVKGNVVSAHAISGDVLLRESAERAALQAKFSEANVNGDRNFYITGIVVYNFAANEKCFDAGILNKKARFAPKPEIPRACRCAGSVFIQVVVDETGKVIRAKPVSGHPLLQTSALKAALKTKFSPINDLGKLRAKGILIYNFDSDGFVLLDTEKNEKDLVGKAINLPNPPFPSFNGKTISKPTVLIQAEIDEKGNVISAKAITGHPVLRAACEAFARAARFSQTKVGGVPVKAIALIGYEFMLTDNLSINVAVKSIKAKEQ